MANTIERFDGRAEDYQRYRERYDAKELLPLLREWSGLTPEWLVADVGAGTGMLSDVFLANGNRVIAIEPNAEMRTACQRLHQGDAKLEVRAGTAEATGLPDASVDMVANGRALHWFDVPRAMQEFKRVLRPNGWLVVIAAGRTERGREANEALTHLLQEFTGDLMYREKAYKVYGDVKELFDGSQYHHFEHGGEMHMDWEHLRGMALSLSHSPRLDDPRFPAFQHLLRDYFDRYQKEGILTLETRCWVNAGRMLMSQS
ncbi:MAG TPA: methyltransferase domain-containing protein [Candidatus Aquilonibacter sp.]|nr:methyltransferase domain-containing protein [Candidatus Aquilonibacter sp.]